MADYARYKYQFDSLMKVLDAMEVRYKNGDLFKKDTEAQEGQNKSQEDRKKELLAKKKDLEAQLKAPGDQLKAIEDKKTDLEAVEARLKALKDQLKDLKAVEAQLKPLVDKETFLELIRNLKIFAQGQFWFFYNGFRERDHIREASNFPKLCPEISKDDCTIQYPPERVLGSTIAQIAADVATIQIVIEQRVFKLQNPMYSEMGFDLFEVADALAYQAVWLSPSAKDCEPDREERQVFTYLANSVHVRVLPYSHVVLIGIPYTCLLDLRSLMAIPHEVGHFRYWESDKQVVNLENLGTDWHALGDRSLSLREIFYPFGDGGSSTQSPALAWGEEIFADVYGMIVGGPLYILTAMDRAMEYPTKGMVDFDSQDPHPPPLIRPLLMIKALKTLSSMGLSSTLFNNVPPAGAPPAGAPPAGAPPALIDKSPDDVEKVTIQLFNRWKRMLKGSFLDEVDQSESDNSADLKFRFKDPIVEDQVKKNVAWNTRNLDPQFPAEGLVLKALFALIRASHKSVVQKYDWAWPKSADTAYQIEDFYKSAHDLMKNNSQGWIDEHTSKVAASIEMGTSPNSTLGEVAASTNYVETPPNSNPEPEDLPEAWKGWVAQDHTSFPDIPSKGYFDDFPPGEDTLYTGKIEEVMDPRARPTNQSWLPVYGAGGWDTGAACISGGKPWSK